MLDKAKGGDLPDPPLRSGKNERAVILPGDCVAVPQKGGGDGGGKGKELQVGGARDVRAIHVMLPEIPDRTATQIVEARALQPG